MSYILDALKRAEQQRGGSARGIVRAPRAMPVDGTSRLPWPWIAAGAFGVGALMAAIALWPTTTPSPTVTSAPGDIAEVAAPPSPPAARPAPPVASAPAETRAPAPSDHRVAGRTASPSTLDRSAASRATVRPTIDRDAGGRPAAPPVVRSAPPDAAPPAVRSAPMDTAPAARPTPRADAAPPVARSAPRPEDTPPVARSGPRTDARVASPSAPDVARQAPPRASAPVTAPPAGAGGDAKALAAKISLQVLSWAPEPKDRFVFLNGRRYSEGQLVDDKLLIERITEDGVVLSFKGERVTLRGR